MRCPKCGHLNSVGVAICDQCDFIMDDSFLRSRGDTGDASGLRSTGQEASSSVDTEDDLVAPDQATTCPSPPDRPGASSPTRAAQGQPDEVDRILRDVEGVLAKIRAFWQKAAFLDRLSVGGSVALCVFCFFPWKTIRHVGVVTGLESGGWFMMLLAASVVALVVLRSSPRHRQRFGARRLLHLQAGAVGLAGLFLLSELLSPALPGLPANLDPEFYRVSVGAGLGLSLVAEGVVCYGTGMLLRQREKR